MSPALMQVFSVGLIWTTFHCVGMCGPIVVGLDIGGVARGVTVGRGLVRVLFYQLGRAATLATLGALAGLAGRGLQEIFTPLAGIFALVFGIFIAASATRRLWPARGPSDPGAASPPQDVHRPAHLRIQSRAQTAEKTTWQRIRQAPQAWLRTLSLADSLGAVWLLGVLLGFLPCMIVIWSLGLAATTASPFEGALVPVLLVAMTTPMIMGATLLPRLFRRVGGRLGHLVPSGMLAISGLWIFIVGLAGLELIPHVHLRAWDYSLMLW